ncbi:MAG: tetratricopeptide repeat protein [Anaerolineae bacterium]
MLPALPDTFPEALRLLRKRARLTQDEMGRAVGYSREQIARLENGSRLPDLAVLAALFVPALFQKQETALVEQFLALAGRTRSNQQVTITRTRETRVQLASETVAALAEPQHRPPTPLLPLIGRTGEVAELLALLGSARLVTVVGAPGIGKSRMALEVANQVLPCFADGVAFAPLADVTAPGDVPYAVLRTLGITPSAGQPAEQAIQAYLAARQLLLVLDNCEHVLESAPLFADWLGRAPRLKLLCTSRVPLDLYGEQEWPLAPLPAPDLASQPDPVVWGQSPALQLLLARVRAADPTFKLSEENLLPLATLCAALDGLPLALELAAVRLRDLPPQAAVQQLLALRGHGQLSSTWLQQSRRNVAERHRTLHAAIEWSVRMLPAGQQKAFLRLGIFAGGGSAETAQAVAEASGATLAALARANLIAFDGQRVTLLETLRAYAAEQLAAAGETEIVQAAHARCFLAWSSELFSGLLGDDQAAWMQQGLADHANCLAALRWALAEGDGATAIALAGNLWWFWYRRGLFDLGQELLEAALQLTTPDLAARARALNGLASIHLAHDDYAASLACHEEGLALRRQLGDALGVATTLHNMGLTAYMMGDYEQAIDWLRGQHRRRPHGRPGPGLGQHRRRRPGHAGSGPGAAVAGPGARGGDAGAGRLAAGLRAAQPGRCVVRPGRPGRGAGDGAGRLAALRGAGRQPLSARPAVAAGPHCAEPGGHRRGRGSLCGRAGAIRKPRRCCRHRIGVAGAGRAGLAHGAARRGRDPLPARPVAALDRQAAHVSPRAGALMRRSAVCCRPAAAPPWLHEPKPASDFAVFNNRGIICGLRAVSSVG